MRTLAAFLVALSLVGCTATPTLTPREYLDEQTAATITTVAEPWILVRDAASGSERDYLSLYAIDVNRMGDHRQYLAVMQWFPFASSTAEPPSLQLHGAQPPITLQATSEEARVLGLARPPEPQAMPGAKWWYFPVDKTALATIAQIRNLRATLTAGEQRTTYVIWRDGSAELSELAAVLP